MERPTTALNEPRIRPTTHHRTARVGELDVFYREAGDPDAPAVVLLHGFPSSSHMYRNLIPELADRYRVVAPDLPGFGLSSAPDRSGFAYTFEMFGDVICSLLEQLGIARYAIYIQDYGAPTGLRMALRHPERITALITQNGNAYEAGLTSFWDPLRALWSDHSDAHRDALRAFLTLEGTRSQYLDGVRDPSRIDPAAWLHDQLFLDRPGNDEIQLDLLYDYRLNVLLYPEFSRFLRESQPPTLIIWGENDPIFGPDGARAYLWDVQDAELHLLDTGHFALEDKLDEMVPVIRDFLARKLP